MKKMFEGVSEEQLQVTMQTMIQIEDNLKEIPLFYCRGAWDEEKWLLKTAHFVGCYIKRSQNKIQMNMSLGKKHCCVQWDRSVIGRIKHIWSQCPSL